RFANPRERGTEMQVDGAADAGVGTVAPEIDAHRLARADEAYGAPDAAVGVDVGHEGVGHAELLGAEDVDVMGGEADAGMAPQLAQLLEGHARLFPVADVEFLDLGRDAPRLG